VARGVAAAHGLTVDWVHEQGYPVTVNDADAARRVSAVAAELLGDPASRQMRDPLMGAEDFSYVLEEVPGAMAFLGACPQGSEPETAAPNHSNLVVFDEEPLPAGVALYAAMALDALAA
jgi:metal-dependent amidase/aminoacylase/carboxypeptidase family protein